MARQWKSVRAEAAAAGRIDEERVAAEATRMRSAERAHELGEVRRRRNLTQAEVAERMGVKQPRVSAIERGDLSSAELGTLESYVDALGGRVRVVAEFGNQSITIKG